ncbi:hypothetical protein [Caballeronia hypogeia]|uniref:hypothetical protein n=1 Tax=Caballeronia hypogeia TaxID=1777140 RepID=UPI000AEE03A2|nr:hypothetical protein [Caballeronia hypogeia]
MKHIDEQHGTDAGRIPLPVAFEKYREKRPEAIARVGRQEVEYVKTARGWRARRLWRRVSPRVGRIVECRAHGESCPPISREGAP